MRTTLDIDDDVLEAAKERARREHTTAGKVISDLARNALTAPPRTPVARRAENPLRLPPVSEARRHRDQHRYRRLARRRRVLGPRSRQCVHCWTLTS